MASNAGVSKEERYVVLEPCRHGIRMGYASVHDPRFAILPTEIGCNPKALRIAVADGFKQIDATDQPVLLVVPVAAPRAETFGLVSAVFEATRATHVGVVLRPTAAIAAGNAISGCCIDCEGPHGGLSIAPVADAIPVRFGYEHIAEETWGSPNNARSPSFAVDAPRMPTVSQKMASEEASMAAATPATEVQETELEHANLKMDLDDDEFDDRDQPHHHQGLVSSKSNFLEQPPNLGVQALNEGHKTESTSGSSAPTTTGLVAASRVDLEGIANESDFKKKTLDRDDSSDSSDEMDEHTDGVTRGVLLHMPSLLCASFAAMGSSVADTLLAAVVVVAEGSERARNVEASFLASCWHEPAGSETHARVLEDLRVAGAGNAVLGEDSGRPVHLRRPPEFLETYRTNSHLMPYLGACLLAKGIFSDPRSHVSREEFSNNGSNELFLRHPHTSP